MPFADYDKAMDHAAVAEKLGMTEEEVRQLDMEGKLPKRVPTTKGKRWRQSDVQLWLCLDRPTRKSFEADEKVRAIDHLREAMDEAAERAGALKQRFRQAVADALQPAAPTNG